MFSKASNFKEIVQSPKHKSSETGDWVCEARTAAAPVSGVSFLEAPEPESPPDTVDGKGFLSGPATT